MSVEQDKDRKGFKCPMCPKSFITERGYSSHLSVHSGAATSSSSDTITLSSKPDVFTCQVCDKNYKSKGGLTKHLKSHAQGVPDTLHAQHVAEVDNQSSHGDLQIESIEWLEDDPGVSDKPQDTGVVSYFEEDDANEGEGTPSTLKEPGPKKRKLGKVKKMPLLSCSTCGRSYQTHDGFMKHRVSHAIEVVYRNAPDLERLKQECPELAQDALKEIIQCKYSLGTAAKVAEAVETLVANSSSKHWMDFISTACEGLCLNFLAEINKHSPNQLRELFVRKSGLYIVSECKEGKLLAILSEILDVEVRVKVMTCSAFLRIFAKKLFVSFIRVMVHEGENPPISLPSQYALTNQCVSSLEFKKIIHYIGGSNVKSVLRTALRKEKRTEEWDRVIEVLKKYFIVGEYADAPDADIMAWTAAQDRGRLIKISDDAFNFFLKLAKIVKPLERTDGSLYIEEVIETAATSPELLFAWDSILRGSLNEIESFKLLHALCSHFVITWSAGIVSRRHDELESRKTSKHHGTGGVAFRATISR